MPRLFLDCLNKTEVFSNSASFFLENYQLALGALSSRWLRDGPDNVPWGHQIGSALLSLVGVLWSGLGARGFGFAIALPFYQCLRVLPVRGSDFK
jgi:hypothetical protein